MYQIKVTNNISKVEWKTLISQSPYSTIFHTQEWIKVLTDTFPNNESCYIVAFGSDGQLVGGMPIINDKRFCISNYLSLPFSTYGGPVVLDEDYAPLVNKLLEKYYDIIQFSKGISWIIDYNGICENCKYMGFEQKENSTHILYLNDSLDQIWKESIHRKRRNEIRQAKKKDVFVMPISNVSDVQECYKMILEISEKHFTRPMPFKLFENIYENMVVKDLCKWNIAYYNDIPVANSIFFTFKDSIFYWMNSSFRKYNKLRSNDLLIYSMIQWGIDNGYSSLNFGSSPDIALGLLKYKESWGTQQKNYFSYERRSNYYKFAKKLQQTLNII